MTFAVAAGADIVSVAAILQKTASAIGVLADGPIQRPRDLDGKTYAGFGYPNEVPTLKAVIKADGGKGEFKAATLDSRGLRGAVQQAGRLHDPVHRVGGRRGRRSGGSTCATSSSPTTASPSSTRSSSPATGSGSRRTPTRRSASSRATVQGLPVRRRQRRRGRGDPRRRRTRACSTRTRTSRRRARSSWPRRLPRRRHRRLRDADARALDRLLEVPVRPGPPRRTRRQAADGAARLRDAVHERLPAVTGRRAVGGAASPVRRRRSLLVGDPARRLGALRAGVGRQPVRPAGADPGPRRAVGLPRPRRSATPCRRSSRRSSGFSLSIAAATAARSRWTGSRGSVARSSRSSSARRRSRSSRSRH